MARSATSQITVGIMLLAVGGILLATRFVVLDAAPTWMLGVGLALAVIAIVRRHYGALVGGMVLLGLGAGMVMGDGAVAGWRTNSWLLSGLAVGFLLVYALAGFLRMSRHPWPAVVGVLLAAIVAARELRDFPLLPPAVVIAVRTWWPAGLVVAGAILLVRGLRR